MPTMTEPRPAPAPWPTLPEIRAVYLDMDGVLVNFVQGALKAHNKPASCLVPGQWFIDRCMGLSLEDFWLKCRGQTFWASLEAMPDADEILRLCMQLDCSQWLLSSPSDDPRCYSGKYTWLCRNLPSMKSVSIFARDKAGVAGPGRLLIDDSEANCQTWQLLGGEAILLPRPWNKMHHLAHGAVEYLEERLREYKPRCRP